MNEQQYEKLFLIRKIMDSYRLEYNLKDEGELGKRFDKLYDMNISSLKHLAGIRGIYHIDSEKEMKV
jgi:hypothetical protein